jgi:hypothetical protein
VAGDGEEIKGKEVIKMPFGDGTGPLGLGPMTGRAAGFCARIVRPGFTNPVPGYPYGYGHSGPAPVWPRWGWGFGRGFGRGWRRWGLYGYRWW